MDSDNFKEEYIDRKIDALDSNKGMLLESSIIRTIIAVALTSIFGTGAFLISKFLVAPAITLALFDAIIPVLSISANLDRKNQIKQIKREIKHLNQLKKQGIKSSKSLDKKRLEKINEYEIEQEKLQSKNEIYSIAAIVLEIVWFVSTCASIIMPIGVAMSIVSLLITTGVLSNALSKDKKILELETSINNLKQNIELGSIYGYTDAKKSTKTNTKTNQKNISNVKTMSKNKNIQASPSINLDNCELVDEYLESLEKKEYTDEKAKELIKK